MKKIIAICLSLLILFSLTGCEEVNKDAKKFKEDYEKINGEKNKSGKEYRTITVDEDNPFTYTTVDELNKKIENKESFIVYFGANWCPWCRAMLPTSIKKAKEYNIKTIYYIDVRPDNIIDNDIRDIYSLDDNKEIYLSHEGTEAYHKFTESLKDILKDYKSGDVDVAGTKFEGAKRIGAPTFLLVKDGKGVARENGTSSLLTDPYMELTDEMIKDMEKLFDNFYSQYN